MLISIPQQESPSFPLSFEKLGKVIDSVGTQNFVSCLTALLHDIVPLNAVHIERSCVDANQPTGFRCEWVGSGGVDMDLSSISKAMTLYYDRFYAIDPLFSGIRGQLGTVLVVRDIGAIPAGEFRKLLFDDAHIAHECVLAHGTRYVQHSIAIERALNTPAFTLTELGRFRKVGEFLFPLLALHVSTSAARRVAQTDVSVHPLAQFNARIQDEEIGLSRREYETCVHLISGKTVPESAAILGVRPSTAESYMKRAFAKLGVRTKRELIMWGAARD
ncbi:helix-turn-helix transcriptional regulator [Bordetella sp. 02P26C-1]|uniref:helix-turn-helix transcriptional regulator n=1 Tax=Bordetella sp. 02P26C-1 TaxID=2683195 RepID=UPI00135559C6|nr:helix-turn-helix transcriptional regulator [Bordetella sp. 02P26C-1]MVW79088.1 LuxR family transcriptional regulator [Bordetella sp. 02P26C-1]